jgi:hypothetical protein
MLKASLGKFAALALLSGLAGCTYWSNDFDRIVDGSNRDFSRNPDTVYQDVDLVNVIKSPLSYMRMSVRFWGMLNRLDEKIFVPMFSTFRQEEHYAFSVWPVGSRVWEEGDRARSIPTMYIRKDNPDLQKVLDAPRYSVILIQGMVMSDFDSGDETWGRLPFIGIQNVSVVEGGPEYDDATIKLLAAGLEDAAQKRPAQAIDRLSKAVQGTLGMSGRALALAKLGLLYEERGRFDTAADHYSLALEADPGNTEAKEGLERALKALERKRAIEEGQK